MSDFLSAVVESWPLFFEAAGRTLALSAVALLLGLPLGALVAAASMSRVRPLRWFATAYIGLVRGTPLITQIFILYFGLTIVLLLPGFWAASIALAFHNSAYIAEILRSGFQSVPVGLDEASRSLGMSWWQTLRRVRGPLAFRTALPSLGNQFIIAVKDSSLAAFVTVDELFQVALRATASSYEPLTYYIIVALYYLAIVLILTLVVNRLEHALSKHRRS
ncbi:ABC transporter permease subunit [Auraticoccus sp. F435]|uniref:ABC transporter permease subunit n=1 Tax=Auraticoccus cholistanensis TaxID=2656650 RepID=A0A6A9UUQ6_9ACTN|nr:amino acid ABC transporter permease [Auraticoccus cholistanensis]MVA76553.1 ABC transporter permease subunit [Auraticoccus cholistanensis]